MTRVFRISYAEHLRNDKEGGEKVDSWRNVSQDVAVVDGGAEEAISKLKASPAQDVDAKLVVERRILGVQLISEAL